MTTDITSTHTYTGTPDDQLTAWLADTPHHWETVQDSEQLVIDTPEGEIHPRPQSWLIRWNDGEVTVASPRITHRVYGPHGLAARLRAAQFTATHWHQAAIDRGDIPGAHAIACIRAALGGVTDPNQLGIDDQAHDDFRAALTRHAKTHDDTR